MMYPFWLNKKEYDIIAKSTKDLSTTYLDGDDRERRLPPDFVECEIVYYKTTNCLCIQGHPEYMPKDSSAVKYINVLIREYLEDTVETVPNVIEEEIEAPNVDDGLPGWFIIEDNQNRIRPVQRANNNNLIEGLDDFI